MTVSRRDFLGTAVVGSLSLGLLDPRIRLETRLTMIGPASAPLRAAIEQLARAVGVAGRVALPGWIPHGELPARALGAAAGLSLHKAVNRNLEFAASATNKISAPSRRNRCVA